MNFWRHLLYVSNFFFCSNEPKKTHWITRRFSCYPYFFFSSFLLKLLLVAFFFALFFLWLFSKSSLVPTCEKELLWVQQKAQMFLHFSFQWKKKRKSLTDVRKFFFFGNVMSRSFSFYFIFFQKFFCANVWKRNTVGPTESSNVLIFLFLTKKATKKCNRLFQNLWEQFLTLPVLEAYIPTSYSWKAKNCYFFFCFLFSKTSVWHFKRKACYPVSFFWLIWAIKKL